MIDIFKYSVIWTEATQFPVKPLLETRKQFAKLNLYLVIKFDAKQFLKTEHVLKNSKGDLSFSYYTDWMLKRIKLQNEIAIWS